MAVPGGNWGLRTDISCLVMNRTPSQWHTYILGKVGIGKKQAEAGQGEADMFQVGWHQGLKGCLLIKL